MSEAWVSGSEAMRAPLTLEDSLLYILGGSSFERLGPDVSFRQRGIETPDCEYVVSQALVTKTKVFRSRLVSDTYTLVTNPKDQRLGSGQKFTYSAFDERLECDFKGRDPEYTMEVFQAAIKDIRENEIPRSEDSNG